MMRHTIRTLIVLPLAGLLTAIAAPAEAVTKAAGHTVIVWHINARAFWVGHGPDPAKLEATLMKQCGKAMQKGCGVAISFSSGGAVLGRMSNGNHAIMYSKISLADARAAFGEECQKQQTECETLREFDTPQSLNKPTYEIPETTPDLYRRFGAIAWSKPVTAPVKVWLATGRNTPEQAKNDALALCRKEASGECVIAQYGADSIMMVYTEDNKRLGMLQESSLVRIQQLLKDLCLKSKVSCKVQTVVDSKVEETSARNISL
jgi:hypothetical protein